MNAELQTTSLPYHATPLRYFAALRSRPGAVLLDSGRPQAPGGRFDILSSDPVDWLEVDQYGQPRDSRGMALEGSAFDAQQRLLERLPCPRQTHELPFVGGLIGYWSYDLGRQLASIKGPSRSATDLPQARLACTTGR